MSSAGRRRVGLSARHGHREHVGGLDAEVAHGNQTVRRGTDADHTGQRLLAAAMDELFDLAFGESLHVVRQRDGFRPGLRRIFPAAAPVDRDLVVAELLQLVQQERHRMRAGRMRIDHVAGQNQEIHVFQDRRLEDAGRRLQRSFQQQLAQMVRNFGQSVQRLFQVQVRSLQEFTERTRHQAPPCATGRDTLPTLGINARLRRNPARVAS